MRGLIIMEMRIENERANYTKSDKFFKALNTRIEENKIKGTNEAYWNDFEKNSGKTPSSLPQYKSAVKRFIDANEKDILSISVEELDSYLDNNFPTGKTKENQARYIKSFLTYSIEKNMSKALKNTDSQLIMSLIPNEYRMLINVLLNK
jgi:hypothetical protein